MSGVRRPWSESPGFIGKLATLRNLMSLITRLPGASIERGSAMASTSRKTIDGV